MSASIRRALSREARLACDGMKLPDLRAQAVPGAAEHALIQGREDAGVAVEMTLATRNSREGSGGLFGHGG